MDSLGWSFISALSTMKPGLTYVVSSGLVQTSDPVRNFSMPATPLTRPELSVALLFGYLPIVLAADGAVTAMIANNVPPNTAQWIHQFFRCNEKWNVVCVLKWWDRRNANGSDWIHIRIPVRNVALGSLRKFLRASLGRRPDGRRPFSFMAEAFLESIGTAELLPQEYQRGYNSGYTAGKNSMSGEYQRGYNAGYAAGQSSASVITRHGSDGGHKEAYAKAAYNSVTVSKSSLHLHFGCFCFWMSSSQTAGPGIVCQADAVVTASSPFAEEWTTHGTTAFLRAILSGSTLEIYWEPQSVISGYSYIYDVCIY